MTKGQNAALEYITDFISGDKDTFSWSDLSQAVKGSGAKVDNWMSIRGILQWFINEGQIRRTESVHVEEYEKITK